MQAFRKIFFLIVLFIVGGVLMYQGFQQRSLYSRLEVEGKSAQAEIKDMTERSGRRGRKSYNAVLSYTVPGGNTAEVQHSINSDFYNSHQIGDTVVVKYLASDPLQSIIEGQKSDAWWLIPGGIIALLIGGGGVALSFLRKK
jgi:hypothetical protein